MQQQTAQIFTIEPQDVERHEVRPFTTKHQVVEMAATVRLETHNLAVKDGLVAANGVRDLPIA